MTTATENTTDNTIDGTDLVEVVADPAQAAAALALNNINPEEYVKLVFQPYKQQLNKAVRTAAKTTGFDIKTTAGMKTVTTLRALFRDLRLEAEKTRKLRKDPLIKIGRLIEDAANEIKGQIEVHEKKYDTLIKAEEARKEQIKADELARERARTEAIENRLQQLRNIPQQHLQSDSDTIRKAIAEHSTLMLDPADYQEFHEGALATLNASIVELQRMLDIAAGREAEARRVAAERAELERLRAEQAEAERKRKEEEARQRAEAQRLEAERAAAERQRLAAEKEAKRVADWIAYITGAPMRAINGTAAEIAAIADEIKNLEYTTEEFGVRLDEAIAAEKSTQAVLSALHAAALAKEEAAATAAAVFPDPEPAAPLALVDDVPEYRGADADAAGEIPRYQIDPADAEAEKEFQGGFVAAGGIATPEPLPAVAPPKRDILRVLAEHYDEDEGVVAGWLHAYFGNAA